MPDFDSSELYGSPKDKLLAEIRSRFDYCRDQWQDIRDEGRTDMQFVSGDPWPELEKARRKEAGRPCLVMDELNQYTNQLVNDIRQNKRAVKVVPRGYGSQDQTAELIGDLIREIEYKSNAQSAYACGFENMCHRSYGGWKIITRYVSENSFDQEILIRRIPNPDSSYPDPDCKESDYSDAKYWFLLDLIPRKEFKTRWPDAKVTDFNADHMKLAPQWIKEDQVQVAEYWRVESKKRKLLQVKAPDGKPLAMFEDELPEGAEPEIINEREVSMRSVVQYITNGVEILEKNAWAGKYIPIVWLTGKELYVDEGSGPKRMLMSLVRLARDPQMMVNYLATCESEVVAMTPKTPWVGAVGQFHNPATWQAANTQPVAYLEYKPQPEGAAAPLGPPVRQSYEPQVQQLELAREANRRSIQAAMGLSSLPTNVQRLNDKSGVALKQIDANEDRGSFHFIDNYEMALEYSGRIINDLRPHIYDAPRDIGVRGKDDIHRVVKINQVHVDEKGQAVKHDFTSDSYEVTISTGPAFQSERDAANEFVDTMVPELEGLQLDPLVKNKLVALLIKLKNVGPIGDEMVELLDPKNGPDQTQAQLQQVTQQAQQYQAMVAELQAELQQLKLEKAGKVIENKARIVMQLMDNENKLTIAEVGTKAQSLEERMKFVEDMWSKFHDQAHELGMQEHQQSHEQDLAARNAQQQQAMAAQQASQPGTNGTGA